MKRIRAILFGVMLVFLATLIEHSLRRKEMSEKIKSPSDWSTGLKLWLLAALIVILCNMIVARRAYGQVSIVHVPLAEYSAITTCDQDNNIVVAVSNSVDLGEYEYVLIHERVHVREMQEWPGGCQAFLNHYREDLKFRFEVEARAYCTDFTERVKRGMPREMIYKLAAYLQKSYAQGFTGEQVLAMLPCKTILIPANTPP